MPAAAAQVLLGGPFYRQAWHGLKYSAANMGLLVSLGTSTAYLDSVAQLVLKAAQPHFMGHVWFESSVLILLFVAAGKYMEAKAKARTGDAVRSLLQLGARTALLLTPAKAGDGNDASGGEDGWVAKEIPAELVQVRMQRAQSRHASGPILAAVLVAAAAGASAAQHGCLPPLPEPLGLA